jgi:small subunit ribosomal protein S6
LNLYEAMFLVDSNKAKQDHAKVLEEITEIVKKNGGEMVNLDKWDERKLAYPIAKRKRGTYYLSHFRADGSVIGKIERSAGLSETILRTLIVCDEDGEAFPVYEVEEEEDFEMGGRPSFRRREGAPPVVEAGHGAGGDSLEE